MLRNFRLLSVFFVIYCICLSNGLTKREKRKQHHKDIRGHELSRIKHHEIISNIKLINITTTLNKQLKFNAFGNNYDIILYPNTKLIASNIKQNIPSNVDKSKLYFATLKEPCHFSGKTNNNDENTNELISISICNNRGIQGSIKIGNDDTIIIKPKNYYYSNKTNYHHWQHEHLVYKSFDFDKTDIPSPDSMGVPVISVVDTGDRDDNNNNNNNGINSNNDNIISDTNGRSRLLENTGDNNVEMLIVSDPSHTNLYQYLYDDDQWYDELIADFVDAVNGASNLFYVTDWGSNVNTISITIIEVILWYDYDDESTDYSSVKPDWTVGSCTESYVCEIDGSGYLGKFRSWVATYQSSSTYDNAHIWSSEYFEGASGWGYVGTVCTYNGYSSSTISARYGLEYASSTVAHELGHNFNMSHDGSGNPCDSNDGVMGSNDTLFSSCSINYLQNYFDRVDMSCITSTISTDNSEYEPICGNRVLEYNEECDCGSEDECNSILGNGCCLSSTCTLKNSTCEWCEHDTNCYEIEDVRDDLDGQYIYDGCYNNKGYYIHFSTSDRYLWYFDDYGWWIIGPALGSWSAYCRDETLYECNFYKSWYAWNSTIDSYEDKPNAFSGACGNGTCSDNILQYGEECDCGEFYECKFIDKCCDPYTCKYKDESECDPSETCSHYPCVTFNGFSDDYEEYNGDYKYSGLCYNDVAYYKHNITNEYLYYTGSRWNIHPTLGGSNSGASAYTTTDDLSETSGTWRINSGNLDSNIINELCDRIDYNPNITDTCDNSISSQDRICINDININNGNSIDLIFNNSNKCKDGYPYYYDQINNLYLHYIPYTVNEWLISSELDNVNGNGHCSKENILSCDNNDWYIEVTDGDSILYEEDTDAYTWNCVNVTFGDSSSDDGDSITTTDTPVIGPEDDDDDSGCFVYGILYNVLICLMSLLCIFFIV